MNRRLIGAKVLSHPIVKRLLESRMFTTSEVVRVVAEEMSGVLLMEATDYKDLVSKMTNVLKTDGEWQRTGPELHKKLFSQAIGAINATLAKTGDSPKNTITGFTENEQAIVSALIALSRLALLGFVPAKRTYHSLAGDAEFKKYKDMLPYRLFNGLVPFDQKVIQSRFSVDASGNPVEDKKKDTSATIKIISAFLEALKSQTLNVEKLQQIIKLLKDAREKVVIGEVELPLQENTNERIETLMKVLRRRIESLFDAPNPEESSEMESVVNFIGKFENFIEREDFSKEQFNKKYGSKAGQATDDKQPKGPMPKASKEEVISAKKIQQQLKPIYDAFEAVLKKYADDAEALYSVDAVKELVPALNEVMLTEQDEDVEKLITDDATESVKRIVNALNDLKVEINKEVQEIMKSTQEETAGAVTEEKGSGAFLKPKEFKDWYKKNIKNKFPGADLGKILQVLKKELADVGIGYGTLLKEYLDKNDLMKALVDAGAIPDNQTAPQLTGQIVIFLKSMAQKHKWPDPKKPEETTPEPAPLTVQQKSFPLAVLMKGELTTQEHGQLVKATKIYGDLYKRIQRWVKIYGLLARFINSGTKKLTGQEEPPQQKLIAQVQQLQLPKLPDPPPPEPDPDPTPEPDPEPDIEDEEEEEDEGIFIPVQEFNKLFDALEPNYELFENRFLKTPFLGKAAKIFTGLYDALIQFDNAAQKAGQANLTTADVGAEQSPATAQIAAKRDDLYEQDTGLGENIRPQLMEILKELRPLVTEVVDAIDRYFETVKTGPQGEDDERSTTIGGGVIEEKITDLMNSIQINLGELNELLSRLGAKRGDFYSLKEQDEEQQGPEPDTPESFTDKGKGKRARRSKVPRAERIRMVRAVYRQVVSNLVEFITAVEGLGDIDSVDYTKQMRPLIENSIDELNTIRNFFPSMAPFGKAKDAREKKQLRREAKNLGRKLNDIVDRLNRMVRQKDVGRKAKQQSRGGVPQQGDQTVPDQKVDSLQEQQNFDKGTLKELDELTISASKMIQDAFGADSKIGKVVAQKREIKDTDAAPTPAGDKAIKDGKATTPEDPVAGEEDKSKAAFNEVDSPQEALTAYRDLKSVIKSRMGVMKDLAPNSSWKNDPMYTYIFYVFLKNDFESVVNEQEEKISGLSGATLDQLGLTVDKVKFLKNVVKARALKKDDKGNPANPDLYFFYTGAAKIISDPKRRRIFMEKVIEPLDDRTKKQQRKFNLNAQDLRTFIVKAVEMRDAAERDPTAGTANENLERKIINKLKPIIERMLHG